MLGTHIAHDCVIGNHIVMANNISLGGHVMVGDYAVLGGHVAVHQHVRIGDLAMVTGTRALVKDYPPYAFSSQLSPLNYGLLITGVNVQGLRRNQYSNENIKALKNFYKILFDCQEHHVPVMECIKNANYSTNVLIRNVIDFYKNESKRGIYSLSM